MATQKKIIEMIMCIKNTYAQYTKDINVEALVKTWALLLQDYPDKAVEVAFYKCLQTCEKPFPPATIIKELQAMLEATETTDEELWSEYTVALRKVEKQLGYLQYPLFGETKADTHKRIDAVWEGLPERLRYYIGSKGELMRMARDYTSEDLKFEKNKFFKAMPAIKKRAEAAKIVALLGDEKLLLEEGKCEN